MEKSYQPIHLLRWDELPDFNLYVDQLIQIIQDQTDFMNILYDDIALTKSMVNNYVKKGIMSRPERKRYGKIQLCQLTVITILKPILSLTEIQSGIDMALRNNSLEEAYDQFCTSMENSYERMWNFSHSEISLSTPHDFIPLEIAGLSLWGKYFTKLILLKERKDKLDEM